MNGQVAAMNLTIPAVTEANIAKRDAIPLIWARSTIADYMRDFNVPGRLARHSNMDDIELKKAVTQLGLDFSLMTQWTSFLAVSKQVVNENPAANQDSKVPLPMPAGVTEKAYGDQAPLAPIANPSTGNNVVAFAGSSAPEPESIYGLLLLSLLLGGFWWFRVSRT